VSPLTPSAPVTTTLMSGYFSTSKKSAERRWLLRLPIFVSTEAALTSIRPKTVVGLVI
jgi:hypothetical protein